MTNTPLHPELVGILFRKEIGVPCFYFDVREVLKLTPDAEGLEFDNLEAERAAAETAAEIGRELLSKGDARKVTVKVQNEHRQRVLTATASLEVHRVDPAALPSRSEKYLKPPKGLRLQATGSGFKAE
jgi:hypothetical protein